MISALNPATGKENQGDGFSRFRNANLKKFYESKLNFLLATPKSPDTLLKLICQDAPYEFKTFSGWGRKSFIYRCVKYYRAQIREIERRESSSWFRWFL